MQWPCNNSLSPLGEANRRGNLGKRNTVGGFRLWVCDHSFRVLFREGIGRYLILPFVLFGTEFLGVYLV
jgi:hypothetical protein